MEAAGLAKAMRLRVLVRLEGVAGVPPVGDGDIGWNVLVVEWWWRGGEVGSVEHSAAGGTKSGHGGSFHVAPSFVQHCFSLDGVSGLGVCWAFQSGGVSFVVGWYVLGGVSGCHVKELSPGCCGGCRCRVALVQVDDVEF